MSTGIPCGPDRGERKVGRVGRVLIEEGQELFESLSGLLYLINKAARVSIVKYHDIRNPVCTTSYYNIGEHWRKLVDLL